MDLAQGVLGGDRRAVARAISLVERQQPAERDAARELLCALYPHTGQAHLVGVTGSPGTGKSTLVNQLARFYRQSSPHREHSARVGIIAVDPSSPFSGGALLGDRVRMRDAAADPGVFVRSMATRGAEGGLAHATFDAAQILDAAGYEVIFVETVGAGQDEVAIARSSHTTLVVEAPGLGDEVQAIKAGLMEIADIFVVNKADRQDADQAVRAIEMMLEGSAASDFHNCGLGGIIWGVPVCKTVALDGTGIPGLVAHIESHRAYLQQSGRLRDRELRRAGAELETLLQRELFSRFLSRLEPGKLESMVSSIASRDLAPYEALKELLGS
jgi:LAO/AO transport system kinase